MIGASPPRVAAIILAAGRSQRMGTPKQLLPLAPDGGETLLTHVVVQTLAGPFAQVVVVVGYQAMQVRASLEPYAVQVVTNTIEL